MPPSSPRIASGCCAPRLPKPCLPRCWPRLAAAGLLSTEHFTVDGTLIEAWASHKSFKRKDRGGERPPDDPGNPTIDFHGEQRSNATHQSTTDPEARLAREGAGKEAKLSYAGHVLMENRNGIAVNGQVTQADGRADQKAAMAIVEEVSGRQE